ncbi:MULTISPECIES: di-heme oxidoreductase family protein [Methylosinus]|uniref:Thiol oxidoreductase n=1 Tax=Methylosinus trichosporium (strain ATCC 35070 / NCIMB 11131 / UNIQEM 75 / OB3b) TaxID=595536 RepID=A0A2D2D317_METT3|nr:MULTISPECIES: di-heme oxidoredictase family protein [Methylosinus]ATQ69259.1 thiol oxidoreductase [Methylosinus trichosporium OB3b]
MRLLLAAAALILLTAGAPYETPQIDGEIFSRPLPGLDETLESAFRVGNSLFRRAWIIGPSAEPSELTGLGPLYNRLSCIACHVKNGRGPTPDAENGVARAMVLRLGVEGRDAEGGPLSHPIYGAQLNPEGIPGVPGEGRAILAFDAFATRLDDGEIVTMRRPRLSFRDLAYGPIGPETRMSLRNAPPVFGLGLLEAVPDDEIISHAAGPGGGRPNHVYDMAAGRIRLGRFGLKANQPTLRQQIAAAFAEDIGVASALFPEAGCAPAQLACRAAAGAGAELSPKQLGAVLDYVRGLAVPARRQTDDARVRRGATLFAALGCSSCHRETLRLGAVDFAPALSGAEIHPYTDLLLHDMGEGLADGRADFEAGPRDWRTPPLWGLGLAGRFATTGLLHDGRAATTAEAILWHGGEAEDAQGRFRALPRAEREALLAFLDSL